MRGKCHWVIAAAEHLDVEKAISLDALRAMLGIAGGLDDRKKARRKRRNDVLCPAIALAGRMIDCFNSFKVDDSISRSPIW